jgi:inner membrane protein
VPSSFSHIVGGIGFAASVLPARVPGRYWFCAGLAAAIPDVDYLWSYRGLPVDHWLAHRGLTHSLVFAALAAAVVTWTVLKPVAKREDVPRLLLALFLAVATHGLFDAMSTYGAGIAFFVPMTHRYFLPWRPISNVSQPGLPIPVRVLHLFGRELLVIWLPALLLVLLWRRRAMSRTSAMA